MTEIIRMDTINEAFITFMGQKARVACDRNCSKAWGNNSRPADELSVCENISELKFKKDIELGVAPKDPGTCEGEDAKPISPDKFPNNWCVRECERCSMSNPGKWMNPIKLKEFN